MAPKICSRCIRDGVPDYTDIVVVKLSPKGECQWHAFFGAAADDWASSLTIDDASNIFITGTSDMFWDGPGGQRPLTAHDEYGSDIFLFQS